MGLEEDLEAEVRNLRLQTDSRWVKEQLDAAQADGCTTTDAESWYAPFRLCRYCSEHSSMLLSPCLSRSSGVCCALGTTGFCVSAGTM